LVSSFDCRVLHTMVYCGAVRSAILAIAWFLADTDTQVLFHITCGCMDSRTAE